MAIVAGQDILASDFVSTSGGAGDSGKSVKLNSVGILDASFVKRSGDGSDGALVVSSGTTTLDLSVKTVWNYTSITISSGATLTFSNGSAGDKLPILNCLGNFSNAGTITTKGKGAAKGTGGSGGTTSASNGTSGTAASGIKFVDGTSPSAGTLGTGAPSTAASGTGGALANKNAAYFFPYAMNGSGGAGGGGGTQAAGGSGGFPVGGNGGDGGAAGLGLIINVDGNYSNTGTIDLRGDAGVTGGAGGGNGINSWNSGCGGGGGGGGAGSLYVKYRGTFTNSGSVLVTGGAAGVGGTTSGGGGGGGTPTYGQSGGGGSGGASAFNSTTAGGNGAQCNANGVKYGGDGTAGGDGIAYHEKVTW